MPGLLPRSGRFEARIGAGLLFALGGLAYWPLLAQALELPTRIRVETWLFRPSQLPAAFVLLVAGWLAWRRRGRLRARRGGPALFAAALLAALAGGALAWAVLTRTTDLMLLSLSGQLLAFALVTGGWSAGRAMALPALVLVLGMPIPAPLRHEIVWRLQVAAAWGADALLGLLSLDFARSGVILRHGEQTFHVIDGCSGLQGMATLLLMALVIQELFSDCGRRRWLLLAAAPALGYALNALRVAVIAAMAAPDAMPGTGGTHTVQGLTVLAIGTGLLYLFATALARSSARPIPSASAPDVAPDPVDRRAAALPWRSAAAWLALLSLLSLALPPFAAARREPPRSLTFPQEGEGWISERLSQDPYFIGVFPHGQLVYRLYERPAEAPKARRVEFLAALDREATYLLSDKLLHPGPEWSVLRRVSGDLPHLGRRGEIALAGKGESERAVIYLWRPRDRGLLQESIRSLLALDSSPLRRQRPRAVVRLVAYAVSDDAAALARARGRLDAFARDFRDSLDEL